MSSTAAVERRGVAMATAVIARTTRNDRTSMLHLTGPLAGSTVARRSGDSSRAWANPSPEYRRSSTSERERAMRVVTVGAKRFSASPRPSTPSRRLGEVTGRPLSLAVLTEGGHDLLRELADQAELVVEVDAHPELTRPGLDRALELLDAVGRGAHDGKAVREVVDEPELGDEAAVGAAGARVLTEHVALGQGGHLRQQLGGHVLALGGEAGQVVAGHGQRGFDLLHRLGMTRPEVDVGPPPQVDLRGIAPGLASARVHLRDGVANDLGCEPGPDHCAVRDPTGQPQRLGAGRGQVDGNADPGPCEGCRPSMVLGSAFRHEAADREGILGELGERYRPRAYGIRGAVSRPDADQGPARGQ